MLPSEGDMWGSAQNAVHQIRPFCNELSLYEQEKHNCKAECCSFGKQVPQGQIVISLDQN